MILVTFYSVSSALYLQSLLEDAGTPCSVIPVPRALSSSCGYAAETACQGEDLRSLCQKQEVEWEAMYRREADDQYILLYRDDME